MDGTVKREPEAHLGDTGTVWSGCDEQDGLVGRREHLCRNGAKVNRVIRHSRMILSVIQKLPNPLTPDQNIRG